MTTLTVASLNTRGMPPFGTHLRNRYAAIGTVFESSDVDVVNFQEVLTYYHLRQLVRSMPSYRSVSFRRSVGGPAGGVVTVSRIPVDDTTYLRFPTPSAAESAGVPRLYRLLAPLKGTLATRLPGFTILNTHLLANRDGDWSETNRFYRLQEAQLAALGRFAAGVRQPAIVSGDFNVSRDSSLYRNFIQRTALIDAFGDDCPPTFHAAFLPAGKSPHCIDFLLVSDASITVESATLTFTGKLPMPGGPDYVTDHLGLQVRLTI